MTSNFETLNSSKQFMIDLSLKNLFWHQIWSGNRLIVTFQFLEDIKVGFVADLAGRMLPWMVTSRDTSVLIPKNSLKRRK